MYSLPSMQTIEPPPYSIVTKSHSHPHGSDSYNMLTPPQSLHREGEHFPAKFHFYGLPTPPMNHNSPLLKAESIKDETRDSAHPLKLLPIICPQSTVNILIESGGEYQTFTLHRDLLCHYSPYFRSIFSDEKSEIKKRVKIKSKMLRREWRWENAKDIPSMEGNGFGDQDGKIEIDVTIRLPPSEVRITRLNKMEVGEVTCMVFAAFLDWQVFLELHLSRL